MERQNVPAARKWRLEDIFESEAAWEALYAEVEGELDFSAYEGKLTDANTVLECLTTLNRVIEKLQRLEVYAYMRHDEDTRASEPIALLSRVSTLEMTLAANTAYVTPELTALPAEVLESFAADPRLAEFDYTLRRTGPGTRPPRQQHHGNRFQLRY